MSMLDNANWHKRFLQQAGWTRNLRNYLLGKIELHENADILDVGCGTGALFVDFEHRQDTYIGLDLDYNRLAYAQAHFVDTNLICAKGEKMPLRNRSFDLVFCHYLLLWIQHPAQLLKEMCRVSRKGGIVAAFSEPDYQARVDHPEVFQKLGQLQNHSLQEQGVNLSIGRQLNQLFHQAGLVDVHNGVLGGEWSNDPQSKLSFEGEWEMLIHDLSAYLTAAEINAYKDDAQEAWLTGNQTLFIPTFYAYGRTP